ncbi:alpha/beta fold hydrolase [Algoriphagus sediminis]|uniref:Alpha/beta hydrolase n=1 Tax=Algoriphagus sediminis TaxID=3057113 RepID=A0ABT7Y8K2_9BACT|nr:alpha/beta hydrolase [Algoriphagus sediminis]MDN3202796.1 alpha/beta hydrolase [Algoriphagus sediminis]
MSFHSSPWGKLHYLRKGSGPNITLIFHGFGQTHKDMLPLDKIRKEKDSFIYIDMFYHGRSIWQNSEVLLDKEKWKILIESLLMELEAKSFNLIGFSMGGKLSLLTYELIPNRVERMILLGPDGIKTGKWYNTSSYPDFFSPALKRVVFKPQRVFAITKGLKKVGVLDKSIYKFVTTQMQSRSKRAQVYFVWKVFGRIQLNIGKIIREARAKKTPFDLFIGEFDAMITLSNVEKFSKKIQQLELKILPVGHGDLIEAVAEDLRK